jgi:hypothetical protein
MNDNNVKNPFVMATFLFQRDLIVGLLRFIVSNESK